jgi:hypothetical protein
MAEKGLSVWRAAVVTAVERASLAVCDAWGPVTGPKLLLIDDVEAAGNDVDGGCHGLEVSGGGEGVWGGL